MSPFNCVSHRASLEKLRNYTATAAFISDIGWKPEGYGHVLCNTSTRDDTICIMVGKVSSSRLNTSPIGNHNREYEQPFSKAKFQFTLVTPDEPALINDFQASIAALEKAQAAMAASEDSAHMVLHQGNERSVRFSAPIFSKRDKEIILKPTPTPSPSDGNSTATLQSSDDEEGRIDEETEKWPVQFDYRDDLEAIKTTHAANPLKVYMGTQFVEPLDVTKTLEGSLVEVHFTVQHFHLARKTPPVHSFGAVVEQVLVLKKAITKSSPYKRKNFRSGPIQMPESPTKKNKPSTSKPEAAKDMNIEGSGNNAGGSKIVVPGNGLKKGTKEDAIIISGDDKSAISAEDKDDDAGSAIDTAEVVTKDAKEVEISTEELQDDTERASKKQKTNDSNDVADSAAAEVAEVTNVKGKGKQSVAVDDSDGTSGPGEGPSARPKRKVNQGGTGGASGKKAEAAYRQGPANNKA